MGSLNEKLRKKSIIIDKHCKGCKYEYVTDKLNACRRPFYNIHNLTQPKKLLCFSKKLDKMPTGWIYEKYTTIKESEDKQC